VVENKGIITGTRVELAKQISDEVGFTIFAGEENVLKHPDVLGIERGTHKIVRAHTESGKTYPVIARKATIIKGEFFI
jgi:hypothetical protein